MMKQRYNEGITTTESDIDPEGDDDDDKRPCKRDYAVAEGLQIVIDRVDDKEAPPIHPHQLEGKIEPKAFKKKGCSDLIPDSSPLPEESAALLHAVLPKSKCSFIQPVSISAPVPEVLPALAHDDSLELFMIKKGQNESINTTESVIEPEADDEDDARTFQKDFADTECIGIFIDTIDDNKAPPIQPHQLEGNIDQKAFKMKYCLDLIMDSSPLLEDVAALGHDNSLKTICSFIQPVPMSAPVPKVLADLAHDNSLELVMIKQRLNEGITTPESVIETGVDEEDDAKNI